MWIKVGDYKRSEIGVVKGWMQSPVTSHQEDIYQTDEPRYQKRREEDTCLITVD